MFLSLFKSSTPNENKISQKFSQSQSSTPQQKINYPEAATRAQFPGDLAPSTSYSIWEGYNYLKKTPDIYHPERVDLTINHLQNSTSTFHETSFTQGSSLSPAKFLALTPKTTLSSLTTTGTESEESICMASTVLAFESTPLAPSNSKYKLFNLLKTIILYPIKILFSIITVTILVPSHDKSLYVTFFIIFGYLLYQYLTWSIFQFLLVIFLLLFIIAKLIHSWLWRQFPNGIVSKEIILKMKNNSILDIVNDCCHLNPIAFYATRLSILLLMNPTESEKKLLLNGWNPKFLQFFTSHMFDLIPGFVKSNLIFDNEKQASVEWDEHPHNLDQENESLDPDHESQLNLFQLPQAQAINNMPSPSSQSSEPVHPYDSEEGIPNEPDSMNSEPLITSNQNQLSTARPTNRSKSVLLPLIISIFLRRILFNPRFEKSIFKLKLKLHHLFSVLAITSLLLHHSLMRKWLKKLPMGFLLSSFLSIYFYLLSHGWPKFLKKIFEFYSTRIKFFSNVSSDQIKYRASNMSDLSRSDSVEEAFFDLIKKFTLKHCKIPKISQKS